MDVEYKFAFGGIGEITNEKIKKVRSINKLDVPKQSNSKIILPKIIGVYQVGRGREEFYDELIQSGILLKTGDIERISPGLICVAYDPTNISKEVLEESIKDRMKRLKIVSYNELPDFYEKEIPAGLNIKDMLLPESIDTNRIVVLERNKNIWELLRRDYGLTRMEAINLTSLEILLNKIKKEPKIFGGHFPLKFGKDILDRFDDSDFKDFLR